MHNTEESGIISESRALDKLEEILDRMNKGETIAEEVILKLTMKQLSKIKKKHLAMLLAVSLNSNRRGIRLLESHLPKIGQEDTIEVVTTASDGEFLLEISC